MDASEATAAWVRRLREPALVFGLFLAAAWLPALAPVWKLVLQAVLGIAASVVIVRSAIRDRVGLTELGLRVDTLVPSSFVFLVVTALPLVAVHRLAGKPGPRPSEVLIYIGWRSFSSLSSSRDCGGASGPRQRDRRRGELTSGPPPSPPPYSPWRMAPNLMLMALVFGAELVWLVCFMRFRNLFALAVAHSAAAIVVKHDLVPGWLVSMKVGSGYWWP